jgi:hypothetical protein
MWTALLFVYFNAFIPPFAVFTNRHGAGLASDLAAAIGRTRRFALAGAAGFHRRRGGLGAGCFGFAFLRLYAHGADASQNQQ